MASSDVLDLVSNISTRVEATLSGFSQLSHLYDLTKNKFKKADNKYGVLPLDAQEVSGVTKYYTVDQRFQIILTTSYESDQKTDADLRGKVKTLQDYCHDVYKDLYDTRCGLNSVVLNVKDIAIDEPDLLESDKVVAVSASFTVTYRRQLGI